jgi:hypothetical protein
VTQCSISIHMSSTALSTAFPALLTALAIERWGPKNLARRINDLGRGQNKTAEGGMKPSQDLPASNLLCGTRAPTQKHVNFVKSFRRRCSPAGAAGIAWKDWLREYSKLSCSRAPDGQVRSRRARCFIKA